MFYVYILRSAKTDKYYTGHAEDFGNRIREHNSGECVSTRNGIPWELVRVEMCSARSEAMIKEKQIKSRGAGRYLEELDDPG
jgi:putative endonuclease